MSIHPRRFLSLPQLPKKNKTQPNQGTSTLWAHSAWSHRRPLNHLEPTVEGRFSLENAFFCLPGTRFIWELYKLYNWDNLLWLSKTSFNLLHPPPKFLNESKRYSSKEATPAIPVTQIKDSRDWALCKHRPRAIAISSPVAPLLSFDCLVPTEKGEFEGMQADFENDRVARMSHKVQKMILNIPSHVYQPVMDMTWRFRWALEVPSVKRRPPGGFCGGFSPTKDSFQLQVWATMTRGQIKLCKCLKEGHVGRSAYIFLLFRGGGSFVSTRADAESPSLPLQAAHWCQPQWIMHRGWPVTSVSL